LGPQTPARAPPPLSTQRICHQGRLLARICSTGHQVALKTVWQKTLRRAKVPYFRIYDLRSTYATRLSAGGVADEWVTQLLRQGDSQVFKRYSQMKLQMKREALEKINRQANEMPLNSGTAMVQ
jgi:integrase